MIRYAAVEELFKKQQILTTVFDSILNNLDCFTTHYDRKVFVIGMTNVLAQSDLASWVSNKIVMIFDATVTMLLIEQAIEQAEQMRRKKKPQPKPGQIENPEEEIPQNEDIIKNYLKDFKKYILSFCECSQ